MGACRVQRLRSALRAGVLSFASPKESSQRKGEPGLPSGVAGCSALLGRSGGLRNSGLGPSDSARPFSRIDLRCSTANRALANPHPNQIHTSTELGGFELPLVSRRATQHRAEQGRALSEPWLSQGELRSPRRMRVAQGTPHGGARHQGGLFFGYFLLATQKKVTRPQGGTQHVHSSHRQTEWNQNHA